MALAPGTRLGAYEITAQIGAGGMGEVYRAKDTRLKRDVAIKVLPHTVAHDSERLARFQREAELLATLNHPNIAQIYGLEDSALVLELVDGPTLADRITQSAIPIDEALPIATQIAQGLQAAHDRDVIHRDLKPANIKLASDSSVKVLDFGLAKAMEPASGSVVQVSGLSQSPTITTPAMTIGGVILGTAAYMSPEQAKGKPVDKRTDIWAFGCVLYEMLTGKRAFDAEDVSETLAAVLQREPDWKRLPTDVPPSVETLIRRCLERDPRRRIADISVAVFLLEEAALPQASASNYRETHPPGLVWWKAAAVVLAVATAVLAFGLLNARQSLNHDIVRFDISPPAGTTFYSGVSAGLGYTGGSISPDGRQFAFTARNESGRTSLWIRRLDNVVARRIDASEGAGIPFWSPDSKWVAFFTPGELRKVEASGGRPMKVCVTQAAGRGGSWNDGGEIVFGILRGRLYRVSASGGAPVPVTSLEPGDVEHRDPAFLPGGRHFFYAAATTGGDAGTAALVQAGLARPVRETTLQVRIGSIDGSKRDFVLQADSKALYAAPGLAVFIRNGTLLAQKFDAERLQLTGDPSTVVEGVAYASSGAFSVSGTGTLAFRVGPGATEIQRHWVDRSGRPLNQPAVQGGNLMPIMSPDEARMAVVRPDVKGSDLWVLSVASGSASRLTFDPAALNTAPVWSPDGKQIAFGSRRNGKWGINVLSTDGSGQERQLTTTEGVAMPMSWSADGKYLVYSVDSEKARRDIWTLSLASGEKPIPFLQTPFDEHFGAFSPDGRWIAYESNETGTYEIYVRPFPERPGKWQVSNTGGELPQWRADGKELFYLQGEFNTRNVMAVNLSLADVTLTASPPLVLFFGGRVQSVAGDRYIVSRDGQRFLMPRADGSEASNNPVTVVLNWTRGVGLGRGSE